MLELILVLVILVIVFGARTLPRIGEAIGGWIAKRQKPPVAPPPAAPPPAAPPPAPPPAE